MPRDHSSNGERIDKMVEGVQIMTTGTTSYVYIRGTKIGSVSYPGRLHNKPYQASCVSDDPYRIIHESLAETQKRLAETSFKTQDDAVKHITKKYFQKIKNNS